MAIPDIPSVESMTLRIKELLDRARAVKQTTDIDPPLPVSAFTDAGGPLPSVDSAHQQVHNAVVETAARRLIQDFLASRTIENSSFIDVWNFLDILTICGDLNQCDPSLALWLVEETLDSQSIDGCMKVFDYLESRREQFIAPSPVRTGKPEDLALKNKRTVILRFCNELLRRLSRAEDAVFCGRVFIFLFQTFPLGDRSSVNHRGEFHVENVTTFEEPTQDPMRTEDHMDVVPKAQDGAANSTSEQKLETELFAGEESKPTIEAIKTDNRNSIKGGQDAMDTDTLYPTFWTLQQAFSNPTKLFSQEHLDEFKQGLDATLNKFRHVPLVIQARITDTKRGIKRKRDGEHDEQRYTQYDDQHKEPQNEQHDEFAATFNPKYLTSRDLFELELSDLAFQRHILVQALIIIDFLLSLTERTKRKLSHLNTQKSLQYDFTLSEQYAEWAQSTRSAIATYLQEGPEGKFYYRMVDTVLARDKNWVRWKMENCPPIAQPPIAVEDFLDARSGAHKLSTKRLRQDPMSTSNLAFLSDTESINGLERLKDPKRHALPSAESLVKEVETVELDLEMAMDDEEKQNLEEAKATKMWRLLRIASKSSLGRFDKVEDGKNLSRLVQPDAPEDGVEESAPDASEGQDNVASREEAKSGEESKPGEESRPEEDLRPGEATADRPDQLTADAAVK